MVERIAKLLNKAERAATPQEAQAYFEKAQSLATAHSISLAKARLAAQGPARVASGPISKRLTVGEPRRHANRHLIKLMSAIAGSNDLKMDIAHNSTWLVLFGFPDDIETAELLWTRISTQMVRHAEEFLGTGLWRADKRVVIDGYRSRVAPMTKQTARAQYYEAFIGTVAGRLRSAREAQVAEQRKAENAASGGTSTDVALRAKDVEVQDYYKRSSKASGVWRSGSRVTGLSRAATAAGNRDGARITLGDEPGVGAGARGLPHGS